jgi:hypothetical protein
MRGELVIVTAVAKRHRRASLVQLEYLLACSSAMGHLPTDDLVIPSGEAEAICI